MLCHTSIGYEEVCERSIPQIEAVMGKLGKHVSLRVGIPWETGDGGETAPPVRNDKSKAPKLSELAAFCGGFKGVK